MQCSEMLCVLFILFLLMSFPELPLFSVIKSAKSMLDCACLIGEALLANEVNVLVVLFGEDG